MFSPILEASPEILPTLTTSSKLFPLKFYLKAPIVLDVPDPENFSEEFNSADSAISEFPSEDSWYGFKIVGGMNSDTC